MPQDEIDAFLNEGAQQQPDAISDFLDAPTPTPFSERVLTGVTDPMFGAAQLITKGGAALGIPGFTGVAGLASSVDGYIKEREKEYTPPEGFDVGRIVGNIASPVNFIPGAGAGGKIAQGGQTALRVAGTGAAAGGVMGAAQPVTEGEDYWSQKAMQTGAGAVLGGAGGVAISGIAKGLTSVSNRLRAGRIDPAQMQVEIEATLANNGVDFNALDQTLKQQLTDEVMKAARGGGEVPEKFLANLATLKQAGIEKPTYAQISQSPTAMGDELFWRHQRAGEELASQYKDAITSLNRKLAEVGGRYPAPLNNPEAGARVMQALREAADRGDSYENALWGIARDQLGRDTPIGDASRFVNNTMRRLEDANLWDPDVIPGGIRSRLARLRDGEDQLTVDVAERLKNSLNQARENPTAQGAGQRNAALGMIRSELEDFLDSATGSEQMRGIEFFRQARAASKDRRMLEQAIPALEDIRYAETATAPDDFLRKFVTGTTAKVSDVTALRDFLTKSDPMAWNQIKGQVLRDIYVKATKDNAEAFHQATYNTELRSLMQSGKYDVLFSAPERRVLENIGKAGRLVEGPQGVQRTGLLGGAKAAEVLSKIISAMGHLVPGVGKYIAEPAAAFVKEQPIKAAVKKAVNPNLTVPRSSP